MYMLNPSDSIAPSYSRSYSLLLVEWRTVLRAILVLSILMSHPTLHADEQRTLYLENELWADTRFLAEGTVLALNAAYTFNIGSITIKVSDKLTSPLHIIGVKVGYAYQLSKEEWEIHGLSSLHELQLAIQPGEEKQLAGFETSMPIGKDIAGFQHWVIMQFTVRDKQHGEIYFYAHEPQE